MTRAFRPIRYGFGAYVQNVVCDYPTTPKAGDLVRVGDAIGYALTDEDSAGYTSVDFGPREIEGTVAAATGNAITVGEKIYFKDQSAPLTNDSSGNKFCGYALGAVDAAASKSIKVLKSAPGGA